MTSQVLRGSLKLSSALARSSVASSRQHLLVSNLSGSRNALQSIPAAFISTSKKNRDTTVTADSIPKAEEAGAPPKKKNWVSYGFSWRSEEEDINMRNTVMFFTVTIAIVGLGFEMAYFPDVRMKDWSQREAFIELTRREALGLPPIDENLVPPENINLPSEEELGDFEIII